MNCATHNDVAAVAFCRTCGKALCQNCTRDVRGVIYCEQCLADRMQGAAPAPGFAPPPVQTVYPPYTPVAPSAIRPVGSSAPNPAVAGILAGFFPIGVGAVYTGQYAKGLSHLVIMVMLILGVSSDLPWFIITMLSIAMGFFYVYQIIDAVRTAHALQAGQPAPDPFGLAQMFGTGEKFEGAKVPTGAAILIGLGVLFLLHTAGLFDIGAGLFVSLILIALGVWLFAKHWGVLGNNVGVCYCESCRTRRLMGPAILVTLGVLFLLDTTARVSFGRTWPALLLVIGIVKLMRGNASTAGHIGPLPPGFNQNTSPPTQTVVPPSPVQDSVQQSPYGEVQQNPGQQGSSGEVKNV